jgi:beta-apo-4'-carotenal oxygenase
MIYLSNQLFQVKTVNDSMCSKVSFGPFVPILAVDNLDEAIKLADGLMSTSLKLHPVGIWLVPSTFVLYL